MNLDKNNIMTAVIELENSTSMQDVVEVVERLVVLLQDAKYIALREAFFVWISRIIIPKQLPAGTRVPQISELKEVKSMLAERVQQWYLDYENKGLEAGIKRGLAEGMEKGKAEGKVEGKAEGKAENLLQLLTLRFGEQPPAVHEQVMQMSEAQISACVEVIFDAASVAQVLQQAESLKTH